MDKDFENNRRIIDEIEKKLTVQDIVKEKKLLCSNNNKEVEFLRRIELLMNILINMKKIDLSLATYIMDIAMGVAEIKSCVGEKEIPSNS